MHPFPEPRTLAAPDGATDGSADGATDGSADGATDGSADGATDGTVDVPGGHLWIQEHVAGAPLRFSVESSGLIRFGSVGRIFEEVPLTYRFAARHVRETLDLEALRAAADDPSGITFFGVATRRTVVDYDWDRLPAVLVTDVWSGARGSVLPPDAIERACERLGLTPVNAVEKEVPARHFTLARYDLPSSSWYDGPAAGVLFRNKTGERALLWHPDLQLEVPEPVDGPPGDLADRFVTDERIERAVRAGGEAGRPPGFDETFELVIEEVVRREYALLYRDGELVVDPRAFRSAAAEHVQRYLEGDG